MSLFLLQARVRAVLRVLAWAGASFLVAAPAWSQPPLPTLSEVLSTATRVEQPLTDIVADVSIVDREAIERSGASGLADVLGRLPGVQFVRNGGLGGTTSLYLRGAPSNYTAVYVDGIRVDSQAGSGGASWEALPLSMIDRIEVLRGPAAAIYGSDSIAGVVQVFSKKGEAGVAPYVGVGAGSQRTLRAQAGVSGAQGALDYALDVAREISRGFDAKTNAGHNPDRDDQRASSASARLGLRLSGAQRLDATLLHNDTDGGYDTSAANDRSLHRMQALGLSWQARWSERYSTRVSASESRDRYQTTPSPYLTRTRLRNYLWQNDWRLGTQRVSASLERREDHLLNAPIDRGRAQNALALGYGLHQGAHTLQLNARHDRDSEFGGKSSGSAAYGYEFMQHWRATASAGTAFRVPTLYQRFSMYGDATLQPETSRNAELGLRWQRGADAFSVTAYRNDVRNLINWVAGPGPCPGGSGPFPGCYGNVGKARYQGLTLAGSTRLAGLRLSASLDWQNPRDRATGKLLARRSKRYATLGAETTWAGWSLGGEWQLAGRRFNDAANKQVLGGYGLLNLSASTRIARDWQLLARVDNLMDRDYVLAKDYATAGRTLYVGLKWTP